MSLISASTPLLVQRAGQSQAQPKPQHSQMTTPQKTALINGVTGQDGSCLAEFLLDKGYIVHGIKAKEKLGWVLEITP